MTRLLVVDDELQLLELVRLVLEVRGYEVVTAPNGPLALECVRAQPFDLVLLDVVMSPWSGLETAERLRALPGAPPVVFLSGLSDAAVLEQGRALGVEFLTKPFRAPDLYAVIERVLAEAAVAASRP